MVILVPSHELGFIQQAHNGIALNGLLLPLLEGDGDGEVLTSVLATDTESLVPTND